MFFKVIHVGYINRESATITVNSCRTVETHSEDKIGKTFESAPVPETCVGGCEEVLRAGLPQTAW